MMHRISLNLTIHASLDTKLIKINKYLQGLSLLTIRVSVKSLRRFMNIKDIFIKQNSVCIVCVMACHEPHKVHTVVDALSNFFQ